MRVLGILGLNFNFSEGFQTLNFCFFCFKTKEEYTIFASHKTQNIRHVEFNFFQI